MDQGEFPARWTAARLAELVDGTTRKWWLKTGIPMLMERGVLRKLGRGYIGRRSAIEAALMGVA